MLRIPLNGGTGRRIPEPRTYRNPMTQAMEWRKLMEEGGLSRAGLARKLGVSRARVPQVLALLRLPPEIQEQLPALPESHRRLITERALRRIAHIVEPAMQVEELKALLGCGHSTEGKPGGRT